MPRIRYAVCRPTIITAPTIGGAVVIGDDSQKIHGEATYIVIYIA